MNYGEIGFKVFIAGIMLLLTIMIQCIFQGITTNDVYQFGAYTLMGWVAQILYWMVSMGLSAVVTYNSQSPV
jgi:hypothetical protein